jgi:hypothetical protein
LKRGKKAARERGGRKMTDQTWTKIASQTPTFG